MPMSEGYSHAEVQDIVREAVRDVLDRMAEQFPAIKTVMDTDARSTATQAMQAIQSHERVCTLRNEQAVEWRQAMTKKVACVESKVDSLYRLAWGMLISLVGILLTIIGWLINQMVNS